MNLADNVKSFINSNSLLKKGDCVLIGVSGGADSVCLTHLLFDLRHELGIHLALAHFNHRLRPNSTLDQKFVQKLAADLEIPCYTGAWLRKSLPGSIEEKAREQRFKFLIDTAKEIKADCIALAHNKNDTAETVLMRILRGSGLSGLRAIMPKRKLYGFKFIRPLLNVERKEIESYLKKRRINFRQDETNRQTKFFRNKLRLKLIPYLKANFKKEAVDILYDLSQSVADDYDFLSGQTEKIFRQQKIAANKVTFSLKAFVKYHDAIKRMLVRSAYKKLRGDTNKLTIDHVNAVLNLASVLETGSVVNLPDQIKAKKQRNSLTISR